MQRTTEWGRCEIYLHQGNLAGAEDLAIMGVDAIVNAANPWLCGGGGVDGAIHEVGGPAILEECERIIRERDGIPLACGEAVLTGGGKLAVPYVIHAVGPVYYDMTHDEASERLAATYQRCLEILQSHRLRSVAFPCISTGAYGFPSDAASPIATSAVRRTVEAFPEDFERIVFCVYSRSDWDIYHRTLGESP